MGSVGNQGQYDSEQAYHDEKRSRPCPHCNGTGEAAEKDGAGLHIADCRSCQGTGTVPYRGSKPE